MRVLPPDDAQEPVIPMALQATPSRKHIEARLKRYVIEDWQRGRLKYMGAHHQLTVEYVLDIISAVEKKCILCHTALLLQGYMKCHEQTTCLSCNQLTQALGRSYL